MLKFFTEKQAERAKNTIYAPIYHCGGINMGITELKGALMLTSLKGMGSHIHSY